MEKLATRAWPMGWALIVVGFFVLVGGSAAWAADYLRAVEVSQMPSWLGLLAALACGSGLSFVGLSLLALGADRKRPPQFYATGRGNSARFRW